MVDYEPLPVMTTIARPRRRARSPLHPAHGSNIATVVPMLDDLERELDRCDQPRPPAHRQPALCRGADRADRLPRRLDPDGLTLWATFQAPHHLRNYLATWLDIPQTRCRVIAPDVGGGFGAKIVWYPELFVAPLLSKRLRRPVKFAQTRIARRCCRCRPGATRSTTSTSASTATDGSRRCASSSRQNLGAYPDPTGLGLAVLTTWMAAGAYRIADVQTSFRTVTTNTTPVAAYRGAGRPEAAYSIERIVDLVARRTGLDPAEVRRRNFIPPSAFPYETHNEAGGVRLGRLPARARPSASG